MKPRFRSKAVLLLSLLQGVVPESNAACVPAPAGLVGMWRGEGNSNDEVAANHGTLLGHAGYAPGMVGQAFSFDGTDSGVRLPDAGVFHLQNLTIEAWIKRANAAKPSQSAPFGAVIGSGQNNFSLALLSDGRLTFSKVFVDRIDSTVAVTDTQWHHVAVTRDGSTVTFYIDGVPAGAGQYASTFTFEAPLTIGSLNQSFVISGSEPFWGLIDEVSLYDRALTGGEIAAVFQANSAGKCSAGGSNGSNFPEPVALANATATYSQGAVGGFPPFNVGQTLDGIDGISGGINNGWAIYPQVGVRQVAVWETISDVGYAGGAKLTFTLRSLLSIGNHTLGRFRLSVTSDPRETFADGLASGGDVDANWIPVQVTSVTSVQGTVFSVLADGSVLATGVGPFWDTYTVEATTPISGITGIRLEALPDPSLPGGGPGRAASGNFVVSEFAVAASAIRPAANSQTLEVGNNSFEAITGTNLVHFDGAGLLLDGHFSTSGPSNGVGFNTEEVIPRWRFSGPAGTLNPTGAQFPGGTTAGQNGAWVGATPELAGWIAQTLDARFEAGRAYRVEVDVGAPAVGGFSGYFVALYANGQPIAATTNSILVPTGTFKTVTLTTSLRTGSPLVGIPIEVRLGVSDTGTGQVVFDNVRVTASSAATENIAITSSAPVFAKMGEDFDLNYRVENQGIEAAAGVVVTTAVPAGFSPVSQTVSQGTTSMVDGKLIQSLGVLPAGSVATIRITGHTTAVGVISFHSQVVRDGSDAMSSDNESDASVEIMGPCFPAPKDLVLWLKGDGNSIDELEHPTAITGALQYPEGRSGKAYLFDGRSGVVISDFADLNRSSFTIETWIRPTALDGEVDIIANKESGADFSQFQYQIGIKGSGRSLQGTLPYGNLAFYVGGVTGLPDDYGGWVDGQASIPLNEWSHVALVVSPTNATVFVNGAIKRSIGGLGGAIRVTNGPLRIGTRSDLITASRPEERFNGRIDEFSFYGRALDVSEIAAVYQAGAAGKCVQSFPVSIASPPSNTSVLLGTDATFRVGAAGTGPFTYQWRFGVTDLPGETNATYTVVGARRQDAGEYSVRVCSALGCEVSAAATLSVVPPPAVLVLRDAKVQSPQILTLPITMVGSGFENAISFSFRFDALRFSFVDIVPGAGAGTAQLLANTARANDGFIGVVMALAAGESFPEGTNLLLNVRLQARLTAIAHPAFASFSDLPVARRLVDANAKPLPATWQTARITILPAEFEGDVSPRTGGDKEVTIDDWVQVGRFVVGLDEVSAGSEFQRVDCAPVTTSGNGLLTVSDWVQAGRFAVGLDPLAPADGPTEVVPPSPGFGRPAPQAPTPRVVSLVGTEFAAGTDGDTSVMLATVGDENALAFSLRFDPALLTFVGASPGAQAGGATINVNLKQAAAGRIGLALALPVGSRFPGGNAEVARLRFTASDSARNAVPLSFSDSPVIREISSPLAEALPSVWTDAEATVVAPALVASSETSPAGSVIVLKWPAKFSQAVLESGDAPNTSAWKPVPGTPLAKDGFNSLAVPTMGGASFFRLRLP